jgi:hypothetical protein
MMDLPQQLMLAYFAAAIVVSLWRHGEPGDPSPYSFWEDAVGLTLLLSLLTWGEFWN